MAPQPNLAPFVIGFMFLTLITGGFAINKKTSTPDYVVDTPIYALAETKVENVATNCNNFCFPVRAEYRESQDYHKDHDGVDFAIPIGTPIYAIADGVVIESVDGFDNNGKRERSYYHKANYIDIQHKDGIVSRYVHLSANLQVGKGQTVTQGQIIALSGNSGMSSGPHLHFGMIKNGKIINPKTIINK